MQMNLISQEAQRLRCHYRNFVRDYVTRGQAGCHLINGLSIWQEARLQKTIMKARCYPRLGPGSRLVSPRPEAPSRRRPMGWAVERLRSRSSGRRLHIQTSWNVKSSGPSLQTDLVEVMKFQLSYSKS